jgi:hypothetical protein
VLFPIAGGTAGTDKPRTMTLRATLESAPGMGVVVAIILAGLCVSCIAERTRLTADRVLSELMEINAARRRGGRPTIGPFDLRCQGCEAPAAVYRHR